MKKTCKYCKAFYDNGINSKCNLGYNIEIKTIAEHFLLIKPTEPCPKPLTYSMYNYYSAPMQEAKCE